MPNNLATETSPYLLQHANNPVDWYPWGDEALSLAKRSERPIFLSIGYSACHWCHVMEHESFENHDIAKLMNQWFVCIKVDREERPDLDQIYMNSVMAMTGSGGWPMSVFLTPDQKPFYGGTYWPPTARWGRPGFREILAGVHDAWTNRREAVDAQANELTEHVNRAALHEIPASPLTDELLRRAMNSILSAADRVHGGFGSAPKFPHPMDIRLALRCWKRFSGELADKASEVLDVALLTLDKMARGGIYDHLGGGFARYSTDERWLVPHFEKMLYDNAQLVPAYLEAFQITGRTEFARVARETLDYILREMTQPQGGFYSTQDADSEGVEGKFFVWSEVEIDTLLDGAVDESKSEEGHHDSQKSNNLRSGIFKRYYDVTARGNWEHSNILNRPMSDREAAAALSMDPAELDVILTDCRKILFEARSQRVWPGRDEKVLVSWNGLMIAAMAMGANILEEPKYAAAARAAADFVLEKMMDCSVETQEELTSSESLPSCLSGKDSLKAELQRPAPHLLHCYKDGRSRFNAYLDDYAALIDGLCELYQAVFDAKYLEAALDLAERMIEQFWDTESRGFYYTSLDHETLIARNKETQDNATPSGNSLAAMGLLKLSRLTGRMDLEAKAVETLEAISGQLERAPLSAGLSLMALDFLLGPTHEIVIAEGESNAKDQPPMGQAENRIKKISPMARLHGRFIPNKVAHVRYYQTPDSQLPTVTSAILSGKVPQQLQTTAYLCQHGKCGMPIIGDQEISTMIERL